MRTIGEKIDYLLDFEAEFQDYVIAKRRFLKNPNSLANLKVINDFEKRYIYNEEEKERAIGNERI